MSNVIEARHISQQFDKKVALDDVSFKLGGAKIYGLLGRNASGKTTLLSILAGFRAPSDGEALLDGSPVFESSSAMREICLIRETGDTFDDETVQCNFDFVAELRPNWDMDYAHRLAERFSLPLNQHVSKLSRGQRSAVGIVIGLASQAPVTMFDESYLGLDAPSRYAFYDEVLASFMENPRIIVLSTHLIEEVSRLLEEVLILDEGRLLLQEEAERLHSRGLTVTGPADAVERFTSGLTVLDTRELGRTRSAVIIGVPDESRLATARTAGLDLEPMPLQDLFVHLTNGKGGSHDH